MEAGPLPPHSPSKDINKSVEVKRQNLFFFPTCGTYQISEEGTVVSKLKGERNKEKTFKSETILSYTIA